MRTPRSTTTSTTRRLAPLLPLALAALPVGVLAQQTGRITGRVTDATSGGPLGEAQVYVPGANLGALSRQDGRFLILNVPAGTHQLRAERIGMGAVTRSVTVTAGGTAEIDFALQTQALGLDEIVVTGTAGAARRREVGNSISQINLAELPARPTDAAQMLQAAAPGVELTLGGGETGNGSKIRLRGANSITQANGPIIYIDGVRIMSELFPNNTSAEYRAARGSNNQPSPLEQINPNDIERIEIIKGSAATTLYGTEASAGVIQVFTKRGSTGKPVWTLEVQQGTDWSRKFGTNGVDYFWMDPWICTGPLECGDHTHTAYDGEYNGSVRGGTQGLQYFSSGGYKKQVGQLPLDELEEWTIRGNFTVSPLEDVTFQWNSALSQTWQKNTPVGGNAQGLPINVFRQLANYYNTTDPDVLDQLLIWDLQSWIRRFTTGGTLTYQPTPSLSNRLTIGYDYSAQDSRNIRPFGFIGYPDGVADIAENGHYLLTFDYVGNYSFNVLPSLKSSFSWGGQTVGDQKDKVEGWGSKFPGAAQPTLSSGSTTLAFEDRSKVWNAGFFFQNIFNLKERYFLTLGTRVDGNSAFGTGFGLQVYPKASASWVASDESFYPEQLGSLKVRMAYGKSGRAPGSFDAVRTWENIGIAGNPAFIPKNVGDPNLGPEVTAELETGFDAAWLDDRIQAGFTYYRQITDDALLNVQQSPSLGFTRNQLMNVGKIRNSGTETSLNFSLIRRASFGWDVGTNVSTNHSLVLTHVQKSKEGKPVDYYDAWIVQNPDEIAAPKFLTAVSFVGPRLPTKIINGNTIVRLPGGVTLAARGELKGGYFGTVEPIDVSRNPRSPACFPYYAAATGVALKPETPALWRARCTPSINRGWNFKQDNFRLTSVSGTFPLSSLPFLPERARNTTAVIALGNAWTWFEEIPHYDTIELDSYRLPSPVTLRVSLRSTF